MNKRIVSFQRLTIIVAVLSAAIMVIGRGHKVIFNDVNGISLYPFDSVECITSRCDTTLLMLKSGCILSFANRDIDSICFMEIASVPIIISWIDNNAIVDIPNDLLGVDVIMNGAHVEVINNSAQIVDVILKGQSENGALSVGGKYGINLTLEGLNLTNKSGGAITNYSDATMSLRLIGSNILADASKRDSAMMDSQRACITSVGSLNFYGTGELEILGNYKHAIYSTLDITADSCKIRVKKAKSDGIRAKQNILCENCKYVTYNIGGNAMNADDGDMSLSNCKVDITLTKDNTNGLKCKGLFSADSCEMIIKLNADQCKGVKASGAINIANGLLRGNATGNVVIKKGSPSYCTFVKSDGNLVIDGSVIELNHKGKGGRGLSANNDLSYVNSILKANFDCDGEQYKNDEGLLDYYTSRVFDSDNDMQIKSGRVDILQTGLGGKGISCGNKLEIGQLNSQSDSLLQLNVETTGTAILNDTILDERQGCPKAIKGKRNVYVYSGKIHAKTHGMGGEGIECGRYMKIEGGEIVCETFDDGINPGKGLKINGGNIFVYSSDNDGIDSNGYLEINGGIVVAMNAHFRDEDFDIDAGCDFAINGGRILGIARDYSRPTHVEQPYIQHIPAYWNHEHSGKDSINVHDFHKNDYVVIADSESKPIISARIIEDIPSAYITASDETMVKGEIINVYVRSEVPEGASPMFEGKAFIGGLKIEDEKPILSIPAGTETFDFYTD